LTPQHHLRQQEGPGEMVLSTHHAQQSYIGCIITQSTAKACNKHKQHGNLKKMVDNAEQKLMAEVDQIEKDFKRGLEKLNDKLTLWIEDVET
jgi:hypothetical protein